MSLKAPDDFMKFNNCKSTLVFNISRKGILFRLYLATQTLSHLTQNFGKTADFN